MRKTYRGRSITDYWHDRWQQIVIDEPMSNAAAYPLANALETVDKPNARTLEIGCGPGRILRYFHQRGEDIVGLDYVGSVVARLKEREPTAKLVAASALKLPFTDHAFDYVLAFGVYHGFSDDNSVSVALREARRVLDNGGLLCVSVRADSLHNRLIDWYKARPDQGGKSSERTVPAVHKLNFKPQELEDLLTKAGFRVESTKPAANMTLFYQFSALRSASHRRFNESLGRIEGYKLAVIPAAVYYILSMLVPWHACNVIVSVARRIR